VSWIEPEANGAIITSYTVYFRSVDPTIYFTLPQFCDGSNPAIMQATECIIPADEFVKAPFDLPWGASIYAKVMATNFMGASVGSNPGNGAVITSTPDAPFNLVENYAYRTKSILSFSWTEGLANGGAIIIDYRINIAVLGEP